MQFLGFDYQTEPPTVTTHFRYDDPEWAPPGAGRTPVAVSRFSDVQVPGEISAALGTGRRHAS